MMSTPHVHTPHVYTFELPNTTVPVNSGNLLGITNNLEKTVRDLEMSGCIRGQEGGVGGGGGR